MTINLNTEELTSLVEKHMTDMGISGNLSVTFKGRNGNQIDTSVEILPAVSTEAADVPTTATATEPAYDSLIK